jgi:Tfp pilus assembly pilus retraction ATPase PilT
VTDLYLWDTDSPEDFWTRWRSRRRITLYRLPVRGSLSSFRRFAITSAPNRRWVMCVSTMISVDFKYQDRHFVYRVHRDQTTYRKQLCLRRVSTEVPKISRLALPPMWKEILLSETLGREGGLVILAAKPGSGKSTTIAGMIRERLERFGGVARTIEAPVEFPLQNSWGKGVCFQIPVDESLSREEQFLRPLRAQMRAYPTGVPSILMVGEIRDGETAAEVINASVGHLVITTMHAIDIETTIRRLCGWSGQVFGTEVAREMVGGALRVVANQRLERVGGRRVATGEMLFSRGAYSPIANIIRSGKFEQLTGEIKTQQRKLAKAAEAGMDVDAFWMS